MHFDERIEANIDGFDVRVSATVPFKEIYTFADIRAVADQALNGAYGVRTLDNWVLNADIVQGSSPRSAIYTRNDLHWFVVYIAFKLNLGRKQAHQAYCRFVEQKERYA